MAYVPAPPASPLYRFAHLPTASLSAFRVLTFKGTIKDMRRWIRLLIRK